MVRGRLMRRLVRLTSNGARFEMVLQLRGAGRLRVHGFQNDREVSRWPGMELAFIGIVEFSDDGWSMYESEPVGVDGRGSGWLPEYEIEGFDDRTIRELVGRALGETMSRLRTRFPSGSPK